MMKVDRSRLVKGEKFGRLEFVDFGPQNSNRRGFFKCSCGTIKSIALRHVLRGATKSCGCLQLESNRQQDKHGFANKSATQQQRGTYLSWRGMLSRCYNKNAHNYKWYGAVGVRVCDEWQHFEAFLSDMGMRPDGFTLDMVDPYREYSKLNCRWIDRRLQNKNKKNSKWRKNVNGEPAEFDPELGGVVLPRKSGCDSQYCP